MLRSALSLFTTLVTAIGLAGTIQLNVTLGGYPTVPGTTTVNVKVTHSSTGAVVLDQEKTIGTGGAITISPAQSGTFDIKVGRTRFLSETLADVPYGETYSQLGPFSFNLKNGDCDGTGTIDIADYAIISTAFDATPEAENWDERADLNEDGIVDIADYIAMAGNMDANDATRLYRGR